MLRGNIPCLRGINFLLDIILTIASFFLTAAATLLIREQLLWPSLAGSIDYRQVALLVLIWSCLIYFRGERYVYRLKRVTDFAREAATLVLYGTGFFLISCYLLKLPPLSRMHLVLFVICNFTALFLLRLVLLKTLHRLRTRGLNNQQVLVVGTRKRARWLVDEIQNNRHWGLQVRGILSLRPQRTTSRYCDIPIMGSVGDLQDLLKNERVDYVMFSVPVGRLNAIKQAVLICEQAGVKICLQTDLFPLKSSRVSGIDFAGKPALVYSREPERKAALVVKGIVDWTAAAIGLIALSPLMLLIATAIKQTSHGPVFFKQTRCGCNGKRFELYKFRTMVADAEKLKKSLLGQNEMDGPVFKITNDPRITRVGKALRKLSLDELPQLINVVKGEMSLVGPRPPLPSEVSQYDIWQRRKLSVMPGLTCTWQVGDRNNSTFESWMKQDLEYIDNWSLWLDAKILLKTIPTVISANGK